MLLLCRTLLNSLPFLEPTFSQEKPEFLASPSISNCLHSQFLQHVRAHLTTKSNSFPTSNTQLGSVTQGLNAAIQLVMWIKRNTEWSSQCSKIALCSQTSLFTFQPLKGVSLNVIDFPFVAIYWLTCFQCIWPHADVSDAASISFFSLGRPPSGDWNPDFSRRRRCPGQVDGSCAARQSLHDPLDPRWESIWLDWDQRH